MKFRTPPPPPGANFFSLEGIYEYGDEAHPNGGSFYYYDVNGLPRIEERMWAGSCRQVEAQSGTEPFDKIDVIDCTLAQ
jgi:hypothetical protein